MRHLNYAHLLYFWTVAREGGVARAAEVLHVTPQTISGQLRLLEDSLNTQLLERRGRSLVLTDTGRVVRQYAEKIFNLGEELLEVAHGGAQIADQFTVGIADVVPKLFAYRVLEPVLKAEPDMRLICREGTLDTLLADLALHNLDMVLADRPVPKGIHVRAYSHPLGDSGVSFLAPGRLARRLKGSFPDSLNGAPVLLPTRETILRRQLDQWFAENRVQPRVVAEFDDSALLKAFGQGGLGVLPVPGAIEQQVTTHYNLTVVGRTDDVREAFYAISVERRIKHPAVMAVTANALADPSVARTT